jgi:hypothetical protein
MEADGRNFVTECRKHAHALGHRGISKIMNEIS